MSIGSYLNRVPDDADEALGRGGAEDEATARPWAADAMVGVRNLEGVVDDVEEGTAAGCIP